ncbi:MAG: tetratricopeptide repeat protein [Candidatus Omnitrophica bacterium]|nr:tetratricopeptide repeat protein [Candidatus Omnitrophota bacterium]
MVILGILAYSHTFYSEFHLDDVPFIVQNPSIRKISSLWEMGQGVISTHARYLTFFTFALNYHFNGLDVFGYHLVNFLIHLLTTCLVWATGYSLFKTPRLKDDALISLETRFLLPFLAALIFFIHPVNTQAVTYITQRFESMAAMFYVGAVFFFIQARLCEKNSLRFIFFAGSLVSAIAGMLSKETVITLPVMVIVIEFAFFRTIPSLRKKIPWLLIFSAAGLFLIVPAFFSFDILGLGHPIHSASHENEMIYFHEYLLTQLRVFATFLRLIFIPAGQNIDYDFRKSISLFEPITTFLSFLVLSFLLWFSFQIRRKNILVSFGIWWFFITLCANLVPRMFVIFEHKAYLAGIGIYWSALALLFQNNKNTWLKAAATVFAAFILAATTFARNEVWKTDIALWQDVVKKSPEKHSPHLNLGSAYCLKKDYDNCLTELNLALDIAPRECKALSNRAVIHMAHNDMAKALDDLNKAITLCPEYASSYQNRAAFYVQQKDYDKAIKDLNKFLKIHPKSDDVYRSRADAYNETKEYEKAILDYTRAIELNPRNPENYEKRAFFFHDQKHFLKALTDYNEAIAMAPKNAQYYSNRANLYSDHKRFTESIGDYQKALTMSPNDAGLNFNLGQTLFRSGDMNGAQTFYSKAVQIDPNHCYGHIGLGHIYYLKNDYEKARQEYEKAITINPLNPTANSALAQLYLDTGHQKEYEEKREAMLEKKVAFIPHTLPQK